MPYSKRWELVHLLGGKCVDCGNENFYDLEIDHINDDGDGERKYYTISWQKYLNQPNRAKKRLRVRCKGCHEKRHHSRIEEVIEERNIGIYNIVDGKIKGHGTALGDISELAVVELDEECRPKKVLRHIIL